MLRYGAMALPAPDVFDQREADGIVILLDAEPAESLHGSVREAATMCPAAAIELGESS
ncbi:ferredoxin I-like 4Fe-4S single cluster protein [Saccharopolyspora spinosa]|uniref:Ferredoxin I-like 4Fe-4S single cluster protein n=1 Tax=Saccharopolyspora spinosa TaxID=60894 RepID=A0A2N3Y1X0_SACSN|nr:ferredoxin I-like 4Fe-4S single cluster protein [Saccharopolyspora spinosa]